MADAFCVYHLWISQEIFNTIAYDNNLNNKEGIIMFNFATSLIPDQKQCINNHQGIICIRGAAGTGKTTAMVAKIISLINDHEVHPNNIYVITATYHAAKEIVAFVSEHIDNDAKINADPMNGYPDSLSYYAFYSDLHDEPEKEKYILIDNGEDLEEDHVEMIKKLAEKCNNIYVTGDPEQSLTDTCPFASFATTFPDSKLITLSFNLRFDKLKDFNPDLYMPGRVIYMFNASVSNSQDAWDVNRAKQGCRRVNLLHHFASLNQSQEDFLALRMIVAQRARCLEYCDIVIMYKDIKRGYSIERYLQQYNIPCALSLGSELYDSPEAKDIIALINIAYGQCNKFDVLKRLSIAHITSQQVTAIEEYCEKKNITSEQVTAIEEHCEKKNVILYDALKAMVSTGGLQEEIVKDLINALHDLNNYWDGYYRDLEQMMKTMGYMDHVLADSKHPERLQNVHAFLNLFAQFSENITTELDTLTYCLEPKPMVVYPYNSKCPAIRIIPYEHAKYYDYSLGILIGMSADVFPSTVTPKDEKEKAIQSKFIKIARERSEYGLLVTRDRSTDGDDVAPSTVSKPTPDAKIATKPKTKRAVKVVVKPIEKPTTKPVAKPTTKPVAKPATKSASKPAVAAKPAAKPAAKLVGMPAITDIKLIA
jgi:superfamily I DNA/RNA helicase